MSRSTPKSGRIDKRVRQARRLGVSAKGLVGAARTEKWLVLPDTTVLVRSVTGRASSPNRDLVEAIVGRVVTCVLSQPIRDEATAVLGRPNFGAKSTVEVDRLLGPLWRAARWVEMAPDDPRFARFVRDDDDVHVIRTAAGTFFHPDLNVHSRKFIVSADRHAFREDTNWNGFECITADEFMKLLRDALE